MPPYAVGVLVAFVLLVPLNGLLYLWSKRRRLERLAQSIDTMRRLAEQETRRREPTAADALPADARALFETIDRELRELALVELGDLVDLRPDGSVVGTTRWFVDASRTVCGWFSAVRTPRTGVLAPVMMVLSESGAGQFFVTARGGGGRFLAQPPFLRRTFYRWDEGLGRVLERHKETVQRATGSKPGLRRIERRDDAVALLGRLRTAVAQWRAAQPPATLLEADVRSLLGDRFAALGPPVIKLLAARGA